MEGGHRKGGLAETVDLPGERREIFKIERRRNYICRNRGSYCLMDRNSEPGVKKIK